MSETVEYAVMTRREGRESIDGDTVTTDIGQATRARDANQAFADYLTRNGDAAQAECVLVMRTCTPWCEVYQPKKENNG